MVKLPRVSIIPEKSDHCSLLRKSTTPALNLSMATLMSRSAGSSGRGGATGGDVDTAVAGDASTLGGLLATMLSFFRLQP